MTVRLETVRVRELDCESECEMSAGGQVGSRRAGGQGAEGRRTEGGILPVGQVLKTAASKQC